MTETVTESATMTAEPADESEATTDAPRTSATAAATDEELGARLAASGAYTDDQVLSMTMWQTFACSLRDQVDKRLWNVERIRQDIRENYGLTPTAATGRILRDSCA